mmetsp:Transcript_14791/g.47894  ORF Transcript_14791/g.47894 Transcript_14791/m.47894 type:complete len:334 (-) Transcript_14791:269-1270(-)
MSISKEFTKKVRRRVASWPRGSVSRGVVVRRPWSFLARRDTRARSPRSASKHADAYFPSQKKPRSFASTKVSRSRSSRARAPATPCLGSPLTTTALQPLSRPRSFSRIASRNGSFGPSCSWPPATYLVDASEYFLAFWAGPRGVKALRSDATGDAPMAARPDVDCVRFIDGAFSSFGARESTESCFVSSFMDASEPSWDGAPDAGSASSAAGPPSELGVAVGARRSASPLGLRFFRPFRSSVASWARGCSTSVGSRSTSTRSSSVSWVTRDADDRHHLSRIDAHATRSSRCTPPASLSRSQVPSSRTSSTASVATTSARSDAPSASSTDAAAS